MYSPTADYHTIKKRLNSALNKKCSNIKKVNRRNISKRGKQKQKSPSSTHTKSKKKRKTIKTELAWNNYNRGETDKCQMLKTNHLIVLCALFIPS